MPGNYTLRRTYVDGDILSAADYVADHQQHIDNQTPDGTDDYSLNVSQMRTVTDTGDDNGESLATSLSGELTRLRYQIKHIKEKLNGSTVLQWYSKSYAVNVANGTITSVKLANGATHIQFIRAVASNVAVNSTSEVTIVSQSITTTRTRVRIRFAFTGIDFNSSGLSDTYTLRIRRAGVQIASVGFASSSVIGQNLITLTEDLIDTTAIGTKTYTATIQLTSNNTLCLSNQARLILEEIA